MAPLYISNGTDAASLSKGAGSAKGLRDAMADIGLEIQPVALAALADQPLKSLAALVKHRIRYAAREALFYLPEGQEIKWTGTSIPQGVIIDRMQITPSRYLKRTEVRIIKYIDLTLSQFFEYEGFSHISDYMPSILGAERLSYETAERVFCYTDWVAETLVERYQIDQSKIEVLRSGANIPLGTLQALRAQPVKPLIGNELMAIFIGKDWRRKGLQEINQAAEILASRGMRLKITAVGPSPEEISAFPHVTALGFVKKEGQAREYAKLIQDHHLGILWSKVEGLPNSLLEALSLGVPVISSKIPPVASAFTDHAASLLELDLGAEGIANAVEQLIREPASYYEMAKKAKEEAHDFSWEPTARRFMEYLEDARPGFTWS